MRVAIIHQSPNVVSETFIRAHTERLPGVVAVFHLQHDLPAIDGHRAVAQGWRERARRHVARRLLRRDWAWEVRREWEQAIRQSGAAVVLAEYGTVGARAVDTCDRLGIPLVVHFHGYDATRRDFLDRYAVQYHRMFERAAGVVAVSRAMELQLLSLGCPREKLIYSPYGVDCDRFEAADPVAAGGRFVAVGRMVEKKGPHLTIAAFARVVAEHPDARLRVIGGGELLGVCRDLAAGLGIRHAVEFLDAQPHERVAEEMRRARAFVQHSITASNGDAEGTPVAILEAAATGLPVISTRHAGIPDVVVEGRTGLLGDERDVSAMARHMLTLLRDPMLAAQLGRNAAARMREYYTIEQSIDRLARVLAAAANLQSIHTVRSAIERELPAAAVTART